MYNLILRTVANCGSLVAKEAKVLTRKLVKISEETSPYFTEHEHNNGQV
jgi:hypothetical protein